MKVSVIMTAKDTADYVKASLQSVLSSDHEDLDIVVVDDHSTDGTGEIIEALAETDKRIRFVRLRQCHGRNAALKLAHKLAVGEAQCWVDSDDRIFPHSISTMLPYLDDKHELTWSIKHRVERDGTCTLIGTREYTPTSLLVENVISHLRVFTTDLFERSGGVGRYDSAIDWDMNLRMTEITEPRHVPHVLYEQYDRPGRMSGTVAQFIAGIGAVEDALERRGNTHTLEIDIKSIWKVTPVT